MRRLKSRYDDGVKIRQVAFLALFVAACGGSQTQQPPPQQPPGYYPPPQQGYYPPPGYPQQQPGYPPPQQQPPPPQQATRPMLAPLTPPMWPSEAKSILAEQISHLDAQNMAKVRGMPLQIDPDPTEVNAYATCTDGGSPFVAVTEGLLEAVDGIAQTRATDELFGTQTYIAYTNAVIPQLLQPKGRAALPLGIIPAQYLNDPRRLSRAHEMWDDIVAFTVGHELSHHYLGHTGCRGTVGPIDILGGWRVLTSVVQPVNQVNENLADQNGCINTLNTGLARAPNYRWSEKGGLMLMDFFVRLERAAGLTPLNINSYIQSHPNSAFRESLVQTTANFWYAQHPGVPRQ